MRTSLGLIVLSMAILTSSMAQGEHPWVSLISYYWIHLTSSSSIVRCDFWVDRFPWKMVIHIILICLTTALVILLITDVADYRRNLEIMWSSLFLTPVISVSLRMETTKDLIPRSLCIFTMQTQSARLWIRRWVIITGSMISHLRASRCLQMKMAQFALLRCEWRHFLSEIT